jgi:lysophospholipase
LPPGAVEGEWTAPDGWRIRTMYWRPRSSASRWILYLNGRADFIEKYAEAYWRWRDADYGIVTFDWRGQGLSGRLPNGRSGIFDAWLRDLEGLAEWAAETSGQRIAMVGHSMGGHLALRYAARAGSRGPLDRLIALSPMVGIRSAPISPSALYWMAKLRVMLGLGDRYPPSHGPYGKRQRSARRQAILTGDPERFTDEAWWIDAYPALAPTGASWRWLAEAIESCRALAAPGVPESVSVPTLVMIGMKERLVDFAAAQRLAERIPGAEWRPVEGAAHELLRETSAVQDRDHTAISAFLNQTDG